MRKSAFGLRALACSVLLLAGVASVRAEDQLCTGFNWPLDTEVAWMGASDGDAVKSGGTVTAVPSKAILLTLKPSNSETLPVVSGVKKQAVGGDSFSGWFKIGNIEKAGLYQISMSRGGWINVAQGGKLVNSTGFTGRKECTILRKSVRYELAAGETLIQVVGAPAEDIKVTVKAAN